MPIVKIQLFSSFSILSNGVSISSIHSPRLQELLAYLLIFRNSELHRSRLAYLFWPDSNDEQARTNLRNLLHILKQTLPAGNPLLKLEGQTVQWNTGAAYELDVECFERAVACAERKRQVGDLTGYQADLEEAVAIYKGDLLPNFYSNWIISERERLNQAFTGALEGLIGALEEQGNYSRAIDYARRLLRQAPLHEAAYSTLMRLQGLSGDRAGGVRTYQACREILQRELGVEPSLATWQVYENLLRPERSPTALHLSAIAACPLIGRRYEWAQIKEAWKGARKGTQQFVLLVGEAGTGKTRLMKDFIQLVGGGAAVRTVYTGCNRTEKQSAYASLIAWLRALQLNRLEETKLAELAPQLPGVPWGRRSAPGRPQAQGMLLQRHRFFDSLARIILGDEQPVILCLDDLQWCDQESLEWVHYLVRYNRRAPLLVIGGLRSEASSQNTGLPHFLLDMRRDAVQTEVVLEHLNKDETSLLGVAVSGQELSLEQTERLFQETEGNPFLIIEAVRSGWLSGRANFEDLSPGMRAMLDDRLADLSPEALKIAGIAACLGQQFSYQVLSEISRIDELELAYGLDELCQQRVLRETGAENYEFSHKKLHQAVYAKFGPTRRRVFRRRAANALAKP